MEVIDGYTHYLPPKYHERMGEVNPSGEHHGFRNAEMLWDVEKRLEDMEATGVDRQVVTIALPSLWRGLGPDEARPLVELGNDEIARLGEEYPDSFVPVGTLPLLDQQFEDEFERCIDDLGMAGIQIYSHVDGEPIDRERFRWIYQKAAREDVPLWIHPQLHEWHDWDEEYTLNKILGWPFDTSLALSRLVFSGVMENNPDLDIVVHHMGAMIPHFAHRVSEFHTQNSDPDFPDREVPEFGRSIDDLYRQFYVDTSVSGSERTFECSYEYFDSDRVVFGSDYPFGPRSGLQWVEDTMQVVEAGVEDSDERAAVFGGNLRTLIDQ